LPRRLTRWTVYPSRSNVWTTLVVFAALSVVAAFLAVDAVAHGVSLRGWLAVAGLALCPWAFWRALGQLRHPLPFAHLDEDGVDCALGRVPWRNVSNVSVAWHWIWAGRGSHPSRRLFLDLRNAVEAPAGATRKYLSGAPFSIPVESDGQLRLPLWGSKETVLEDVGRYYSAV
jgi:hypothetical protein